MRQLLVCAVHLLVMLCAFPAFAGDWVGPGEPCRVDIKYYFQFDDQREVARMLRKACARCMMDVRRETPPDSSLLLGCGPVVPDKRDHALVTDARRLVERRHQSTELVFVMKMSRNPTLEEMVRFMEAGVRFYREIEHYAYVARASAGTIMAIRDSAPIEWMGVIKAEQKYVPARYLEPELRVDISSVPGDMFQCRADIERLGGTVIYAPYDYWSNEYVVNIDLVRLNELASLWWVLWITPTERYGAGPE